MALLRSVNVSGRNRLSMEQLRALATDAGYERVRTYLQSGNLICSGRGSASSVARVIEERMAATLGWSVPVLARTRSEIREVLDANPFPTPRLDPKSLHVTFLGRAPRPEGVESLTADDHRFGADRAVVVGREVFLHCPGGYGRTKLDNAFLERRLGTTATTRNWRTVTALAAMAEADD